MKTKILRMGYVAAFALLTSGSAAAQNNVSVWQESYMLESAGKYAQASAFMDSVLRESPTHEFALMRHAWLNYLQGKYNDALRDYNHILFVNPQSLEARLGLTLPLMAQQRWREAAIEAHKVIAVSEWDYTAHMRMLVCEEAERKWDELAHHATELALRYPSDASVLVYLARAEAWRGNIRNAKAAYIKVLTRVPAHVEALAYLKNNP